MIRGFDASSVQGIIPFAKIQKDLEFVLVQAQRGNDLVDPRFEVNARAAIAEGLETFAYCFAYVINPIQQPANKTNPTPKHPVGSRVPGRDPYEQAALFAASVARVPDLAGKPIAIDLESPAPNEWADWGYTPAQASEHCRILCAETARITGCKIIIYTYPWWWDELAKSADVSWAAEHTLWMADYKKAWPVEGQRPKVPKPWDDWGFWQWDGDKGETLSNGVDADFCVFNGSREDLTAFAAPNRSGGNEDGGDDGEIPPVLRPRVPLPDPPPPREV